MGRVARPSPPGRPLRWMVTGRETGHRIPPTGRLAATSVRPLAGVPVTWGLVFRRSWSRRVWSDAAAAGWASDFLAQSPVRSLGNNFGARGEATVAS